MSNTPSYYSKLKAKYCNYNEVIYVVPMDCPMWFAVSLGIYKLLNALPCLVDVSCPSVTHPMDMQDT